jgi:hypothetical protein
MEQTIINENGWVVFEDANRMTEMEQIIATQKKRIEKLEQYEHTNKELSTLLEDKNNEIRILLEKLHDDKLNFDRICDQYSDHISLLHDDKLDFDRIRDQYNNEIALLNTQLETELQRNGIIQKHNARIIKLFNDFKNSIGIITSQKSVDLKLTDEKLSTKSSESSESSESLESSESSESSESLESSESSKLNAIDTNDITIKRKQNVQQYMFFDGKTWVNFKDDIILNVHHNINSYVINNVSYTIDIDKMTMTQDTDPQNVRDIRIKGQPIVMYKRDDGEWKCYEPYIEDRIYGSYVANFGNTKYEIDFKNYVVPKIAKCLFTIGKTQYEIDFTRMKQRNITSGFERDIRIEIHLNLN